MTGGIGCALHPYPRRVNRQNHEHVYGSGDAGIKLNGQREYHYANSTTTTPWSLFLRDTCIVTWALPWRSLFTFFLQSVSAKTNFLPHSKVSCRFEFSPTVFISRVCSVAILGRVKAPKLKDQTNIHVYPDWAAMQAYYGHGVALPPYCNSALAAGHAPHPYMWGPHQPMMPPYGGPYAAIYSPGGVYAHPAVSLAAAPSSVETPSKPLGKADHGLMKKLKGFDGLAMSIGNGNAVNAEAGSVRTQSQSVEAEGSCDGSDRKTDRTDQIRRRRSCKGTPVAGESGKTETQNSPVTPAYDEEMNAASGKVLGDTVPGKSGPPPCSGITTALEIRISANSNTKTNTANVPRLGGLSSSETWIQNERELKQERRKQSNRESARRSRLRRQAEAEELGHKVELLTAENMALKSEVNQLMGKSEKLRTENSTLLVKLKNAHLGKPQEMHLKNSDDKRAMPVSTENLLSRVNNSGSADRGRVAECDVYENDSRSGTKLRQLLDANPRADAVAAG
ncbi:common plant regulatory factor 1-like isoform X3 [Tripterygium wilfordii]|uniref:common plant regulatory factor 1-like isoform X3 n=1 Tax=Tripterygium wilfordii TaxID=458696 RepID=UPI0018F81EA8|nr:common plant regulatory factor 1-like isoform X3 [Tripterygium wilfordii]